MVQAGEDSRGGSTSDEAEDLVPVTSSDQDCPTLAPARPRVGRGRALAVVGALAVAALAVFLATR